MPNIDAVPHNADWLRSLSLRRELDAMDDVEGLEAWLEERGMDRDAFLALPAVQDSLLDHPLVQEL